MPTSRGGRGKEAQILDGKISQSLLKSAASEEEEEEEKPELPAPALQCGFWCVSLQQCGASWKIHCGSMPATVRAKSCEVSTISPATIHCGWEDLGLGGGLLPLTTGFLCGSPRA